MIVNMCIMHNIFGGHFIQVNNLINGPYWYPREDHGWFTVEVYITC